jgi:argonaute-like protein implicated in RNA metabolism and viral defense
VSYGYVYDKKGIRIGGDYGEPIRGESIEKDKFHYAIVSAVRKMGSNPDFHPEHLIIHRDGFLTNEEEKGLKEAIVELENSDSIPKDIPFAVVQIKKSQHPYRILNRVKYEEIRNPIQGSYFVLDELTGIIATTGYPVITQGTAAPLLIELKPFRGTFELEKILHDIFYLTELNWSAPLATIKLPLTLRIADAISYRVSEGIRISHVPA